VLVVEVVGVSASSVVLVLDEVEETVDESGARTT
jgi:hypothetical protein